MMKNLKLKFRLFVLPLLLVTAGVVTVYSLLNYLYIVKGLELLNTEVIQFFIPALLAAIGVYVWLYPRFKLVEPRKGKDQDFNLALFAWIAVLAPLIVTQIYLDKAVGYILKVDNVEQINTQPKSKFYQIKNCCFDKSYGGSHTKFSTSGRYNEYLDFTLYVAVPVFKDISDTANNNTTVWLGKRYTDQMSSRASESEKEDKYQAFVKSSLADFNALDLKNYTYLVRVPKSDDQRGFDKAIERSGKSHAAQLTILTRETEPFEARTGSTFNWIFYSFGIAVLVFILLVAFQQVNEHKLTLFQNHEPTEKPDPDGAYSLLIPKEKFFVTPILIDLNIAIYLAMVLAGLGILTFTADDLLKWGGDCRPLTAHGEWWRLISSMFLHGGIMHLVGNMFGLYFAGVLLEPLLGRVKYLFAYMVTGIASGCASIWWHVATVSIGASGAIFGMFGVLLALLLMGVFPKESKKGLLITTAIFIGYNLIFGLVGGIDNAAHLGGLISGIIVGFILSFTIDKKAISHNHEIHEAVVAAEETL